MNTSEDAKKIGWILKVLGAKLKESQEIKVRTEITSFDEDITDGGALMMYFAVKDIPLFWAEISCLEESFFSMTIVLREKTVTLKLHESGDDVPENNGIIRVWDSFESFRAVLDRLYANMVQYKPGVGPKIYANVLQYLRQQK